MNTISAIFSISIFFLVLPISKRRFLWNNARISNITRFPIFFHIYVCGSHPNSLAQTTTIAKTMIEMQIWIPKNYFGDRKYPSLLHKCIGFFHFLYFQSKNPTFENKCYEILKYFNPAVWNEEKKTFTSVENIFDSTLLNIFTLLLSRKVFIVHAKLLF